MSRPIKIDASLEGPLFRNMGTFWTSVFQNQPEVRVLLDVALRNRIATGFKQAVHNMAGDPALGSLAAHVQVSFKDNDIIEAGMQLYDDPDHEFRYGDLDNYESKYGNYRIRYFALQLSGILPLSIHSPQRTLVLGVDFFLNKDLIYFRQDPRQLFPSGSYLITRGVELNYRSYLSFFTQNNVQSAEDMVVRYLRQAQTPQNFRLALCAIAGMGIIRSGGPLRAITKTFNGATVYTFDQESVRVAYPHTPLEIDVRYPPLTVIGNLIQVAQGAVKDSAWWRQINWRGGFLLDPIVTGMHNLPVVDTNFGVAYVAGQEAGSVGGSKVHARVQLSPDFAHDLPYWEAVAKREAASNHYLNSSLGLPEEVAGAYAQMVAATATANQLNRQLKLPEEQPDFRSLPGSILVNPLDVFFQAILGQTAYVIAIDQLHTPQQHEVFNFLSREMPSGGTPIIIGFITDLEDEPLELEPGDTVVITNNTTLRVTDEAYLDDHDELIYLTPNVISFSIGEKVTLMPMLGAGDFPLTTIYRSSTVSDRTSQNIVTGLGVYTSTGPPTDVPLIWPTPDAWPGSGIFGPIEMENDAHVWRYVAIPDSDDPNAYCLTWGGPDCLRAWVAELWRQFLETHTPYTSARIIWANVNLTDTNWMAQTVFPAMDNTLYHASTDLNWSPIVEYLT